MKRRFTWVELLVVIVIIAVSLVILIPALNSHREAARRTACLDRSRQIGLGFQNYASTFNSSYPPSASVITAANGKQTVGGYSFLVRLLPFLDHDALYKTLPADGDPEDTSNAAIAAAMNTQISGFACPSSPRGSAWRASGAQGITNYKAMGATTRGSLVMLVDPQATPPYGTMTPINGTLPLHPDGAIFPGNGIRVGDVLDGTSHTIATIETIDESASRWTVGKEATLVGMPQSSSPTGAMPQAPYTFFVQPGYDPQTWGVNSGVTKAGMRTFLSYDFSPRGADAGKYEDAGFGQTPPAYGPSSMHPKVVICGMGDGSAQPISKQIDAANLFFLITKSNADPFWDPAP